MLICTQNDVFGVHEEPWCGELSLAMCPGWGEPTMCYHLLTRRHKRLNVCSLPEMLL